MNHVFSSRITKLLPPLLLALASGFALGKLTLLPAAWRVVLVEVLPLLAFVAAFFLSLQFHRSRYSLLLVFVGIGALMRSRLPLELPPYTIELAFGLLFLNCLVFSFSKDRALFSVHGLLRLGFVLLQFMAAWYLLRQYPGSVDEWFGLNLFVLPGVLEHYLWLPDVIVAPALAFMLLHVVLSISANSSVQATFLGCQMGLFGIASAYPQLALVPFLLGACSLMIALAIIMDSHDMAYRDELTRLPSRRALNQKLLSLGRCYTIAMLDIDHFKKFNDIHGHDVGDEVLKMVAARIARVGGGGRAYRYGGEEFTIVFARKSPEQVEACLDALRHGVENYQMIVRGNRRSGKKGRGRKLWAWSGKNAPAHKRLSVTISIGFAERSGEVRSPEAVIKAADRALYRAKKNGRNRVSA